MQGRGGSGPGAEDGLGWGLPPVGLVLRGGGSVEAPRWERVGKVLHVERAS